MEKLALCMILLIVVLIAISYGVWRLAKNLGVAPRFRIYLICIVVIITTAIYLHFCVASLKDNKNSSNNTKEEVVFQL